jgi:hypothetical protein
MELVDVVSLARRSGRVPADTGGAVMAIERAQRIPGVIAVGALRRDHVPEAERESLATLTMTFTELDGSLDVDRFLPRDSPGTLTSQRDLVQLSDRVTRFERLSVESPGDGRQRVRVLLVQYLCEAEGGLLALTFSTTRPDMMSAEGRDLFDALRRTASIAEQPTGSL